MCCTSVHSVAISCIPTSSGGKEGACGVSICFVNAARVCLCPCWQRELKICIPLAWQKRTNHQVHTMLCNPVCQLLRVIKNQAQQERVKGAIANEFVADSAMESAGTRGTTSY